MITCKNCQTEPEESTEVCSVCRFPITGTEKEQGVFIAQQIMQKSDVEHSFKTLKHAQGILYFIGVIFLLWATADFVKTGFGWKFIANVLLALLFAGFGWLTLKRPKTATLIPLILVVLYCILPGLIMPEQFLSGLFTKTAIIGTLGYAYFRSVKSDKILKANPYLASVLGYDKLSKRQTK